MPTFRVEDMSCQHCVRAITRAIQTADAGAEIRADVAAKLVSVERTALDEAAIAALIGEAGYTPAPAPASAG